MIAPQRDHTRKCLSMLTQPLHFGIRGRFAHQDAIVAILNLLDGEGIVIRCHRDVTTVEHCRPAVERVRS